MSTQTKPTVLVSACLMGTSCRYHGRACKVHSRIRKMQDADRVHMVPVCPEVASGMAIPRAPTRRVGDRLMCDGEDVTKLFCRGAELTLSTAQMTGATKAYLVRGSPSCDKDTGVTATLLQQHGIKVVKI